MEGYVGVNMLTTCEGCGAFVIERTWDRERSFVERYACGSRHRWGEGPEQLDPCPIQRAQEIGAAMERAAVLTWLRECVHGQRLAQQAAGPTTTLGLAYRSATRALEVAAESIERGEHVKEEP